MIIGHKPVEQLDKNHGKSDNLENVSNSSQKNESLEIIVSVILVDPSMTQILNCNSVWDSG